ncbi:hypothetical protein B9Z55_003392 [Caenorhabditis nigoni]|uniref:GH18 domain-containing protein n=1 Tax=Caenorhabditis nigoni TaxID=1611254 RepID=A0A2G5VQ67_9PELO|nr:hypothetical protein B9Z55_003392 [Caenorhabditis nigoni]
MLSKALFEAFKIQLVTKLQEVVGNDIDLNDLFNSPSKPECVENNKNNNNSVEYDYPSSEGNDQEEGIYEYIDEFSKPVLFFKKHFRKALAVLFLASLVAISIIVFLIVPGISHHPGTATTTKVSPDTTPTYTTATTTKVQTTTESGKTDTRIVHFGPIYLTSFGTVPPSTTPEPTTTTVPTTITTTEPTTVTVTTTPEPTTTTVPTTITTTEPTTVTVTTTPEPTTTTVLSTTTTAEQETNLEPESIVPFRTVAIVPNITRTLLSIEEKTTTTTPTTTTAAPTTTTEPTDTVPTTTTTVPTTTITSPNQDQKCAKRIIGYFTDYPNLEITKNQLKNLTHAVLTSTFLTDFGAIEYKDSLVKNRLGSMKKLSGDDTKVMISLGGNRFFSELLQTEKSRKLLAYNIVDFLVIAQIDGVDLFWKWPTASDNENYSEFVKILRKTMLAKNSNLILSVTSAPAGIPGYWPVGFNLEEMINNVDFINVFSTDFYGPWSEKTGPAAPLYYGVHPTENYTVDYTVQYYVCKLKDPKKLNIVVPFDVRIWENVGDALEPTKCEVFRKAELKSGKVQGTIWTSRRQAEEAGIKLLKASWDESTKSSYVWNRDEKWISTFEDKKSLEAKLDYVKAKNLGGVWIRSVDMDDGSVNLLDSIDFGGYCASESDNAVKYQC